MTQYISRSSKAAGVQWKFWKSSQIHYSMQAVYTYEDKGGTSERTNPTGIVICARRISRHLKGECDGGPRRRTIGI